jgi:type IV secretory pathway TrbF-like protein
VLESEPVRQFSERSGSAQVPGARWVVFALAALAVIAALGLTIYNMVPLVKTIPYMVKVDDKTDQVVGKPVAASDFKVERRFIEAEARAFVRGLMTLDPFVTRSNLERVSSRTAGKATAEFKEFLATERPFERLAKTTGLVRTTEVSGVDATQKNIVFVFAQTSERISAGEPIVTRWRFILHYVIEPAVDTKGITENPLGFVVSHFERVQDSVK